MNIKLSLYVLAAGALVGTALTDIAPANAGNHFKGNCSNGGFHRPNYHGKKGHDSKPDYKPEAHKPDYTPVVHKPDYKPEVHKPDYKPTAYKPDYKPEAPKPDYKPNNPWKGNASNHNPKPSKHEAHKSEKPDYDYKADKPKNDYDYKADKPKKDYDYKADKPKNDYDYKADKPKNDYDYKADKPKNDYYKPVADKPTTPPSKYPSNNCWKGNGSNHNPKPSMPGYGGGKPKSTYCYAHG
jgi:hypothetical protein